MTAFLRKSIWFLGIAAIASLVPVTESYAACSHGNNGKSGYCPLGTCSESGGKWACNLKKCSAANCRH